MKHAQRGQVLPLWILAILTTFVLTFLALNYGNQIRAQIRAQNAADAAAQALLAIQTERWNMMTSMLYASSVEEYRIRHLLDGILLASVGSGGCDSANRTFPSVAPGSGTTCENTYQRLSAYYQKAVNRYTTDVLLVNDITARATNANWAADAQALFTHLKTNCNNPTSTTPNLDGGDCMFQYTLNGVAYRTLSTSGYGLASPLNDAYVVLVPTQGYASAVSPYNTPDYENQALFAPPMVDVVVCSKVQPLIPAFGVLGAKPYYAVGRAGATAQIYENDWLQPGQLVDPARGSNILFQPVEVYDGTPNHPDYVDWYSTDFGGNTFQIVSFVDPNTKQTQYGYSSQLLSNEMSAFTAWWSSIPIDPRNFDKSPVDLTKVCPA